ncbi:molecular chaperone [Saccharomonospora marina XMU15]|uniref:Anhydro-N-acetylmuramic acid kinase n=1 Tax=Saccharomonospora marina XMU15 TaxID=882083 RepID=H5WZE0_9PSEU|nr:anhydro-N-acetylmuramic acid kinase [Saccharomonospora marina]EHR49602.1 molecular chaperone [Saccharomonospora marina XMU15]
MAASSAALRVVGLISGTSIDGIDVAVAQFHRDGDELVLDPLGALEFDYPPDLREELHTALPPACCDAQSLTRLDTLVGQAFAEAAEAGVHRLALGRAHLVASLGQTLYHWVEHGTALGTLQLGQPAWVAERTGLAVVADLRARDIAAGGHGAPLAATLDALWLRTSAEEAAEPVAALNIGGIANLTVVHPDGSVLAYDTGPGNALLDAAAAEVTGGAQHSDVDGALAARGRVRPDLLRRLLSEPYYSLPPPKSTGKEVFHSGYLREATEGLPPVAGPDLLATLTELTAATIRAECGRHGVTTVVTSGGGLHNPALVSALGRDLSLVPSDELGLPADAKEAYLSALLGWLTWHGLPANLPGATGARGLRLLGSITPGHSPLHLPPPSPPVHRLRVARNVSTR